MIKWSPTSSVFCMDSEGMTRAWPTAPLISRKTRPTQNQATTSRQTFSSMVSCGSLFLLDFVSGPFFPSHFTFTGHVLPSRERRRSIFRNSFLRVLPAEPDPSDSSRYNKTYRNSLCCRLPLREVRQERCSQANRHRGNGRCRREC